MEKKVLVVAPVHDLLVERLALAGYSCDVRLDIEPSEAMEIIAEYHGVITSTRLVLDKRLIDKASRLEWIGRLGSGMEKIDTVYAAEQGIACFSSPEGNANAVAEQALGMLLGLQHRIVDSNRQLRAGIWEREGNTGEEIEGLTAGIIGYGNNGSAFARKLKALGLKVLAHDKYKEGYGEEGIDACDLSDIEERADILSFHLPLNQETHHYFDEALMDRMRKPFVLLNLSRGGVVDTGCVYEGMKSGKIKAAALDVWETEPVSQMAGKERAHFEALIGMPHFIGTPHIGGYTEQAFYKMSRFLADKIVDHVRGL